MSASDPFRSSQPSSGNSGCIVLIVVLAVLGVMALGCVTIGAAGLIFYRAAGKKNVANWQPPPFLRPPPAVIAPPVNDWFADRLLSPIYVTALDAVATNTRVVEALGDSIAPTSGGEEGIPLFRRVGTGGLNPAGETIEFDVKGAKGAGVVSVLATGPDNVAGPPGGYVEFHVAKIKVKLEGGSEIEVPPPSDQPAVKPIR
jgi:hypothetical protein